MGDNYFSTLLPPPNITGELHLGHFWNATLQDALIRFYKSQWVETYWAVGLDHAGISFQSKYWELFKKGNKEAIDKQCEKSKKEILRQFKKLNFSFSETEERFEFTCSEKSKKIVKEKFEELAKEGLIFKDYRPIHWDPVLNTAISDEEITYKEEDRIMYYIWYGDNSKNKQSKLLVGTTEPETIPWDVALFMNPSDDKAQSLSRVSTPTLKGMPQRNIPIYLDEYIDKDFGTGVMKCSPLKNSIDYELAIKHNIPMKCCPLSISREQAINSLRENKSIEKEETIKSRVPYFSKSGSRLEIKCGEQLFLDSPKLAEAVLPSLENQETKIYPQSKQEFLIKIFKSMRSWCISRQIQWGIPLPNFDNISLRRKIKGIEDNNDFKGLSERDVLDTWFSSSLWPIITSKGERKSRFFPFSILISGQDILAPWIAKMIFMAYHFKKQLPFKEIYLHGLVLDKDGQKMSKSKGNGVDPIEEAKYLGEDALKLFFLANTRPNSNISYSREKVIRYKRFILKISNAYSFLKETKKIKLNIKKIRSFNWDKKNGSKNLLTTRELEKRVFGLLPTPSPLDEYFLRQLWKTKKEIKRLYKNLEFSLLTQKIIDFIKKVFCNEYLEYLKWTESPESLTAYLWYEILYMLRPLAPKLTEKIYSEIYEENMPEKQELIVQEEVPVNWFFQYMKTNEDIRKKLNFGMKQEMCILVTRHKQAWCTFSSILKPLNQRIKEKIKKEFEKNSYLFSIPDTETMIEILPPKGYEDKFATIVSEKEDWLEKEVKALKIILSSDKFSSCAPKELVEEKREKLRIYEQELEIYNSRKCPS